MLKENMKVIAKLLNEAGVIKRLALANSLGITEDELGLRESYTRLELKKLVEFFNLGSVEELLIQDDSLVYDSKGIRVYKVNNIFVMKDSNDKGGIRVTQRVLDILDKDWFQELGIPMLNNLLIEHIQWNLENEIYMEWSGLNMCMCSNDKYRVEPVSVSHMCERLKIIKRYIDSTRISEGDIVKAIRLKLPESKRNCSLSELKDYIEKYM